jgi:hypothetical protein
MSSFPGIIAGRVAHEFRIELPMLLGRWKQILFGALFQYFHGMSTQLAHRMHRPQLVPLHDIGFEYLPELGLQKAWVSESIFWSLFIPFVLWSFSPFVTARKRFYTAVIYARILVVLSLCQFLRIVSFTVTQLPAPNYHCRSDQDTAVLAMPEHWWQHIVINLGRQATHGCGDLIFSSHTTFVLVGCLTFTEYGETLLLKVVAWLGVAMMSLCIVASRKHYSVDVVVAWYVVPLVFYAMMRRWTTVRPPRDYWPHRPLAVEEDLGPLSPKDDLSALDASNKSGKSNKPLLPVVSVPVEKGAGRTGAPSAAGHARKNSGSGGHSGGYGGGHARRVSSSSALRDLELQSLVENGDAADPEEDKIKASGERAGAQRDGTGLCTVM